jgi:Tol biopolymer transport system component
MFERGFTTLLALALGSGALVGGVPHGADALPGSPSAAATAALPDGPIAYTKSWRVLHQPGPDERQDIFKVRPDGSGNQRLTYFRDAGSPRWSPTGNRIAFERPGEVWVMNGDGSERRRLTEGRLVDWMPDGEQVLVVRGLGNQPAEDPTWVLHDVADGAEEQLPIDLPLVPGLEEPYADYTEWSFASEPALSPDGEHLALMLWRYDDDGSGYSYYHGSMFTVRLDGTDLTRLPKYTHSWGTPSWSPGGGQLLYWSEEPRSGCASQLGSFRVDGTDGTVEIEKRCAQAEPTWSPDGKRILFINGRSNSLQIARRDGSRSRTVLPRTEGVYRSQPDWRGSRGR